MDDALIRANLRYSADDAFKPTLYEKPQVNL
jgi:hypothetical protein